MPAATVIGLVLHAGHRPRFEEAARTLSGVTLILVTYEQETEIRERVAGLLRAERLDGLLLGLVPYARSRDLLPPELPVAITRSAALDLALAWSRARGDGLPATPVSIDTFARETVDEVAAALDLDRAAIACLPFDPDQPVDEVVAFHRAHLARTGAPYVISVRTGVAAALAGEVAVLHALATPGTIRADLHELALRIRTKRADGRRFAAGVFLIAKTEIAKPGTAKTGTAKPVAAKPEIATTGTAKTEIAKLSTAKTETAGPEIATTGTARTEIARPGPANPDPAKTGIAKTGIETGADLDRARVGLLHLLLNTPDFADAWIDNRGRRGVVVFAHAALFEAVTRQWVSLPVLAEARAALGVRAVAGFGLGDSARLCVALAERAAARAEQDADPGAYLISDTGLMIGPMGTAGTPLAYTYREHGGLEALAARAGLSAATLSRLAAIERTLDGRPLSPGELARALGITDPSGRRLIRKLAEGGLVAAEGSSQLHRKGRPTRLYRMTITSALGGLGHDPG